MPLRPLPTFRELPKEAHVDIRLLPDNKPFPNIFQHYNARPASNIKLKIDSRPDRNLWDHLQET